jgi:hypothetical protein
MRPDRGLMSGCQNIGRQTAFDESRSAPNALVLYAPRERAP